MECRCVICQDEEPLTDFTTLACGHTFHSSCVAKWLWEKRGAMSCPCCRSTPFPADDSDDSGSESSEMSTDIMHNIRQQRKVNARLLHNALRRKFTQRRQINKQNRYKVLGARIADLNTRKAALSETLSKEKRLYKANLRASRNRWDIERRCIYDEHITHTKDTKLQLSKINGELRNSIRSRAICRRSLVAMVS